MMDPVHVDRLEALVQDLRRDDGIATDCKLGRLVSAAIMFAWSEGFEVGRHFVVPCTEEERASVQGGTTHGSIKGGSGEPE